MSFKLSPSAREGDPHCTFSPQINTRRLKRTKIEAALASPKLPVSPSGDFTFQPSITAHSRALAADHSWRDPLEEAKVLWERRELQMKKKEQQELAQCTFRPDINKLPVTPSSPSAGEPFLTRSEIYEDERSRRLRAKQDAKMAEKAERDREVYTFSPLINPAPPTPPQYRPTHARHSSPEGGPGSFREKVNFFDCSPTPTYKRKLGTPDRDKLGTVNRAALARPVLLDPEALKIDELEDAPGMDSSPLRQQRNNIDRCQGCGQLKPVLPYGEILYGDGVASVGCQATFPDPEVEELQNEVLSLRDALQRAYGTIEALSKRRAGAPSTASIDDDDEIPLDSALVPAGVAKRPPTLTASVSGLPSVGEMFDAKESVPDFASADCFVSRRVEVTSCQRALAVALQITSQATVNRQSMHSTEKNYRPLFQSVGRIVLRYQDGTVSAKKRKNFGSLGRRVVEATKGVTEAATTQPYNREKSDKAIAELTSACNEGLAAVADLAPIMDIFETLQGVPQLAAAYDGQFLTALVKGMTRSTVAAGEVAIKSNGAVGALLIVSRGEGKIVRSGGGTAGVITERCFAGASSLAQKLPRRIQIEAVSQLTLHELSKTVIEEAIQQFPHVGPVIADIFVEGKGPDFGASNVAIGEAVQCQSPLTSFRKDLAFRRKNIEVTIQAMGTTHQRTKDDVNDLVKLVNKTAHDSVEEGWLSDRLVNASRQLKKPGNFLEALDAYIKEVKVCIALSEMAVFLMKANAFREVDAYFRARVLSRAEAGVFPAGSVVTQGGSSRGRLVLLASGAANVCVSEKVKVGTMGPGTAYGEDDFFANENHYYTVRTTAESEACWITWADVEKALAESKDAKKVFLREKRRREDRVPLRMSEVA